MTTRTIEKAYNLDIACLRIDAVSNFDARITREKPDKLTEKLVGLSALWLSLVSPLISLSPYCPTDC